MFFPFHIPWMDKADAWLQRTSPTAKIVLGLGVLLIGWMLLATVSSTVVGWNDQFEHWVWQTRNSKLEKKVLEEQNIRIDSENKTRKLELEKAEIDGKYSIAVDALQKTAAKGASQDEINSELQANYDRVIARGLPEPVSDAELLDRLRRRQARTGQR